MNWGLWTNGDFVLSKDNDIPIVVFDMNQPGNLVKVLEGETIGTKYGGKQNVSV